MIYLWIPDVRIMTEAWLTRLASSAWGVANAGNFRLVANLQYAVEDPAAWPYAFTYQAIQFAAAQARAELIGLKLIPALICLPGENAPAIYGETHWLNSAMWHDVTAAVQTVIPYCHDGRIVLDLEPYWQTGTMNYQTDNDALRAAMTSFVSEIYQASGSTRPMLTPGDPSLGLVHVIMDQVSRAIAMDESTYDSLTPLAANRAAVEAMSRLYMPGIFARYLNDSAIVATLTATGLDWWAFFNSDLLDAPESFGSDTWLAGLSVLERITEDIVTSLEDMTTVGAFANTATDVLRPNPGIGNDTVDRRLIVIQGDSDREWDAPEQYTQFLQDFLVLCMVMEPETSITPIDERLNSLAADVETCLCAAAETSGHGGITRGGLAEDTILQGRMNIDSDVAAHDGAVMVHVQVRYRVRYNQPLVSIYDA